MPKPLDVRSNSFSNQYTELDINAALQMKLSYISCMWPTKNTPTENNLINGDHDELNNSNNISFQKFNDLLSDQSMTYPASSHSTVNELDEYQALGDCKESVQQKISTNNDIITSQQQQQRHFLNGSERIEWAGSYVVNLLCQKHVIQRKDLFSINLLSNCTIVYIIVQFDNKFVEKKSLNFVFLIFKIYCVFLFQYNICLY